MPFGHRPDQPAASAGRTFPPEILTTDEVAALIGGCPATAPAGIRNREGLPQASREPWRVSGLTVVSPAPA